MHLKHIDRKEWGNFMKFQNSEAARLTGDETPYVSFPVLEQYSFIKHGFSTRLGGVSEGIYSTMNLGFGRGDADENVIRNYERISQSIGVDSHSLVMSDQVHKTILRKVTSKDCGKGIYRKKDYKEIDGLHTDQPGITLVTAYADCVPLYFVDPVHKAIALSHAGWRGTIAKIGPKTVQTMIDEYQSRPEDIVVVIGPSICQDCYEVSEEVAAEFQKQIRQEDWMEIVPKNPEKEEKYQLNLWKANRYFLEEAGVLLENIHISGVCTCCNADLFHSHRASHGMRGSLSAFLALTEEKKM